MNIYSATAAVESKVSLVSSYDESGDVLGVDAWCGDGENYTGACSRGAGNEDSVVAEEAAAFST